MDANALVEKIKAEVAKRKKVEDETPAEKPKKKPKKSKVSSKKSEGGSKKSTKHAKVKCPFCGRTFVKHYYTTHIRIHTGEKPYQCVKCNYSSALISSLKYHTDSHHSDVNYSIKSNN